MDILIIHQFDDPEKNHYHRSEKKKLSLELEYRLLNPSLSVQSLHFYLIGDIKPGPYLIHDKFFLLDDVSNPTQNTFTFKRDEVPIPSKEDKKFEIVIFAVLIGGDQRFLTTEKLEFGIISNKTARKKRALENTASVTENTVTAAAPVPRTTESSSVADLQQRVANLELGAVVTLNQNIDNLVAHHTLLDRRVTKIEEHTTKAGLTGLICEVLMRCGNLPTKAIVKEITSQGEFVVVGGQLNSILYNDDRFERDQSEPPIWSLKNRHSIATNLHSGPSALPASVPLASSTAHSLSYPSATQTPSASTSLHTYLPAQAPYMPQTPNSHPNQPVYTSHPLPYTHINGNGYIPIQHSHPLQPSQLTQPTHSISHTAPTQPTQLVPVKLSPSSTNMGALSSSSSSASYQTTFTHQPLGLVTPSNLPQQPQQPQFQYQHHLQHQTMYSMGSSETNGALLQPQPTIAPHQINFAIPSSSTAAPALGPLSTMMPTFTPSIPFTAQVALSNTAVHTNNIPHISQAPDRLTLCGPATPTPTAHLPFSMIQSPSPGVQGVQSSAASLYYPVGSSPVSTSTLSPYQDSSQAASPSPSLSAHSSSALPPSQTNGGCSKQTDDLSSTLGNLDEDLYVLPMSPMPSFPGYFCTLPPRSPSPCVQ
eukprot:TRINITY_DN11405_c0_g1::TRINITY_DN11405_c0_g1_i1::g.26331::m.26331 TRINITY_DN11405_c0_g1::TRINITY_DN11405_c0_g1_i1::g.26331  ORF type:complete len:650 (-),score=22.19 TRINITY_DN11405_c0_g1_i1:334-2283(-)